MGNINLQFSCGSDLSAWAIKRFEHGAWSHVDAILPDGSLLGARDDICKGIPSGVRIRPPDYYAFAAIKKVTIYVPDVVEAAFYSFLRSQVGKPYDETAIVAFVFDRNWRDNDSWFCSELQAAAGEAAGLFPYKLAITDNRLTPGDLFLAASVLVNVV